MSSQPHTALRVARVIPEGRAGVTLVLDGSMSCEPGQFLMAWLPGIEERPFSIMGDDPLALTVASVGPFTAALNKLRVGNRLWVRGPYGHGFTLHGQRPLLIAGGSGAAGLALLALCARARARTTTVVLGARSEDFLMLRWHYAELGCNVVLATDDGSCGRRGTVLDACEALVDAEHDAIYACGPEAMLRAVARYARRLSLPCWISLERTMKCGIGVCGSCHCGDKLVCADGPVFPAQLVLADTQ
jgi:dihydroorotate dehydrogenase electron transfer subunit